jgi:predicted permease
MNWWQRLRQRSRMEQELERELRFHLEQHADDLAARGVDPAAARREARLALGGPEQVKDDCRDARGTRWLEDLAADLRYTVRGLGRQPGFTAVAIATLALGIGATTLIFTLVDGVLLKPLNYARPDRLLRLQEQTNWSTAFGNMWGFSYPNYLDCAGEVRSVSLAAVRWGGGTVTKPGEPENISGRQISSGLFSLLGVPLYRGREFLPAEDRPGGPPVAIVGYTFWQQRFAGADAIGAPLVMDGSTYQVVGIAPPDFHLGGEAFDIFTPIAQNTDASMRNRAAHGVAVIGRLHDGITLGEAGAELALVGHRVAAQHPDTNRGRIFVADPLTPVVGDAPSTLWLLFGAVTLVLLIACVNIASLMLARAVSRERELAMRVALGAGRGRLLRQCLTESAVLGAAGGALGVALAALALKPFVNSWPGSLPRADEVRLDATVLSFALAVSLLSALLFGLAPALRVPARSLEQALRSGARSLAGGSRRIHGGFVIAEIALAVVLLVSAGMLGRTLLRLSSLDPGVDVRNVLTARVALPAATMKDPPRARAAWDDLLMRAHSLPGVRAAAVVDTVPMREGYNLAPYRTSAAPVPDNQQQLALATCVTPGYLAATGIPLREGRFFTAQDRMDSQGVTVIDDIMAHQAFGSADPVGKQLWIEAGHDPVTVIGVVGHVRYWGLAGDDANKVRAQVYYPFAQVADRLVPRWSELMSLAVRTTVPPLSMVAPLKRQVRGAAGDQVIYEVRTFEDLARSSLDRQRFLLLLFGNFSGAALLLACVGIYGVLAYLTSRRVPEIGVRMALGATTANVFGLVMRHSLKLTAAGLAIGAAAAVAAARILARVVEGMRPAEPLAFALMIALLLAAALLASFLPARRASRIDPIRALRQE